MPHPSRGVLEQFNEGRLTSETFFDTVAAHLQECAACSAILQELPEISLADRLKTGTLDMADAGTSTVTEPPQTCVGQLGPYPIVRELTAGGMGRVYLAHEPQSQLELAIKTILPDLASSQGFRERFLREAQILVRLTRKNSDHIVPIQTYGEVDGVLYMVMPFLQG